MEFIVIVTFIVLFTTIYIIATRNGKNRRWRSINSDTGSSIMQGSDAHHHHSGHHHAGGGHSGGGHSWGGHDGGGAGGHH